jgi:peptidyl-dipeptidase Dcp
MDQDWHQLKAGEVPDAAGVMAFEKKALAADGVDFAPVPPRYHTPYFRHIMAGSDSYDAGYYAYIWAEVLDANSRDWFRKNGGATRSNGQHFRDTLLSRGGSVEAMKLFGDFAGHEPRIEPLLKKRGLSSAR